MAESALRNKTALAHELKRSVKGEAGKRIKSVYNQTGSIYHVAGIGKLLRRRRCLHILTMRDVDRITELLPNHLKVEWRRRYRNITPAEKV